MEHVDSQQGKPMILYEGFSYRFHRLLADGETASYRCPQRNCKGRIRVNDDVVEFLTDHECGAPNPAKNAMKKLCSTVKKRAADTEEAPRTIITASQGNLTVEEAAAVPSYTALQQRIERKRKRDNRPYPEPATVADVDIPQELRRTETGQDFIFFDSGANDPRRFIVCATQGNIDVLRRERHWFVDGTFRVSPRIFLQVITSPVVPYIQYTCVYDGNSVLTFISTKCF
jgi:hypothetical protein